MLKKFLILATTLFALFAFQPVFAAVEINTADQAALDGVAGIGPATSRAILEERKKNGNFKDWSDLEQRVRGIGERNSVKLSAAGLVVNGQPKNPSMAADKPAKPAKISTESNKTTQQKN
jgi:competence protein ComEA